MLFRGKKRRKNTTEGKNGEGDKTKCMNLNSLKIKNVINK
jgi:hypothetical protein